MGAPFLFIVITSSHSGSEEGGVAEDVEDVLTGGYQKSFALATFDTVDVGFAPETYHYDERICVKIDLLCHLHHHTIDVEVRAVDELRDRTGGVVAGAIFWPHLIVDGLLSLLDVQLTWVSLRILTTIVIDAVGDVAGLLNLCKEGACTYGMQTTCRQEEEVALMGFVAGYHIHHL